jgi:hypothetical protein
MVPYERVVPCDDVGMVPQPALNSLLDLEILHRRCSVVRAFGGFIGSVGVITTTKE